MNFKFFVPKKYQTIIPILNGSEFTIDLNSAVQGVSAFALYDP